MCAGTLDNRGAGRKLPLKLGTELHYAKNTGNAAAGHTLVDS